MSLSKSQKIKSGKSAAFAKSSNQSSLLNHAEYQRILLDWNNTAARYPRDKTIAELFAAQAKKTPHQVALVFEDQKLTYQELNAKANQLARYLREKYAAQTGKELKPDTLICLCLERSPEMIVAILAALKAGGAYVPIYPYYPNERISYILQDTKVALVITQEQFQPKLAPIVKEISQAQKKQKKLQCANEKVTPLVLIDNEAVQKKLLNFAQENLGQLSKPENLAYVIYTSGTTGAPKGVMIEQESVINSVLALSDVYDFNKQRNKTTAFTSYTFDVSVLEFFIALFKGAELHLLSEKIRSDANLISEYIQVNRINYLYLPPALLAIFPKIKYQTLRAIFYAGEPCDAETGKYWSEKYKLYNYYGPTEATIYATGKRIIRGDTHLIGKPIVNTKCYILDKNLSPTSIGVIGELHIAGVGLARGYLHAPELTEAKFIPNLYATEEDRAQGYARLYKTGDLVRWLVCGNIEYIGRADDQVKIRGFRVELGEIESVLVKHAAIKQCVVIASSDTQNQKQLIAYYVVNRQKQTAGLLTHALKEYLAKKLPDYMLPAFFIELKSLPLNPNGKVDKKALPKPEINNLNLGVAYIAPRTHAEKKLAAIWREVLPLPQIGIKDNFFDLGGNSLNATQVITRINEQFKTDFKVATIFEFPSIEKLADLLTKQKTKQRFPVKKPLTMIKRGAPFLLSFAEQRLWFLNQYEETKRATYNVPIVFELIGALDITALGKSFNYLINRHESLRTSFTTINGEPRQIIHDRGYINLPIITIKDEKELNKIIAEEAIKPFDLTKAPLLRVSLFKIKNKRHFLLINMHHIITDGWSEDIFLKELSDCYAAFSAKKKPTLMALPFQYVDFTYWQRKWLRGKLLDTQVDYWRKELKDFTNLDLPLDYARPAIKTYNGKHAHFLFGKKLSDALQNLSNKTGTTLFMVLLAALNILLARLSGQDDIIIGAPIANRNYPALENIIGFFANTLALRSNVSQNLSFTEFLKQVKDTCLRAYAYQDVPFEYLVEALKMPRDLSRSPIFQVMLAAQNAAELESLHLPDIQITRKNIEYNSAKFDLLVNVTEVAKGLAVDIEYNSDLFAPATMTRLIKHYEALLQAIVRDATQPIHFLKYLTSVEQHQVLVDWNKTARPYPKDKTIHELFAKQVAKTPNRIAVAFCDRQITYQELNKKANQLANFLRKIFAKKFQYKPIPDTLAAICLERDIDWIIALLGVLKAGFGYMPLNPNLPKERLKQILQNAQVKIMLTNMETAPKLVGLLSKKTVLVDLDRDAQKISREHEQNLATLSHANNLAYVIHTSGSTGVPKGVLLEHKTITNLIAWQQQYGRQENIKVAQITQFADISFDVSMQEIFYTLLSGYELHIVPEGMKKSLVDFVAYIKSNNINKIFMPTGLLEYFAEEALSLDANVFSALREIIVAGEALQITENIKKFFGAHPRLLLLNHYGPSESHVVTSYELPRDPKTWQKLPPIGKPISNTCIYILDRYLQPVGIGVAGELYIGGIGLARGYLKRPDLTQEKFINNPFFKEQIEALKIQTKLYKTGDLARRLADGNLEYIGRADNQIKIRGFRIELGEIEAVLAEHPEIKQVAAIAYDHEGEKKLAAYCVPKQRGAKIAVEDLKKWLIKRLPEYMIPTVFMFPEAFTFSASGKINKKALPQPVLTASASNYVAPRNEHEKALADIWSEVLKISPIGIQDNFFSLGGHSLSAIKMVYLINKRFQINVLIRTIFEAPTIAELADKIFGHKVKEKEFVWPTVEPDTKNRFAPFPLTDVQYAYWVGRQEMFKLGNIATHCYDEYDYAKLNLSQLEKALNKVILRHSALRIVIDREGRQRVLAKISLYCQQTGFQVLAPIDPSSLGIRRGGKERATGVYKRYMRIASDEANKAENQNAKGIYKIKVQNLTKVVPKKREQKLLAWRDKLSHQVFDTTKWPLFDIRVSILPDRYRLHFSYDAIIFDALSQQLFLEEWTKFYQDLDTHLPALELQFRDYVLTYEKLKLTDRYKRDQKYWLTRLPDLPIGPGLPLAVQPKQIKEPKFARFTKTIDSKTWAALKQRVKDLQLIPTGVLLAAFGIVLSRWSKTSHFLLNLTLFDRLPLHDQVNEIIGDFTSLELLEFNQETFVKKGFQQGVIALQNLLLEDLEHILYSGVEVLRELSRVKKSALGGLAPVVFTGVLGIDIFPEQEMLSGEYLETPYSITQTSQVWLDNKVYEINGCLIIEWDFVEGLFAGDIVAQMHQAYCQLIEHLAKRDWQQPLPDLLPQKTLDLITFTNSQIQPIPSKCLQESFIETAKAEPQRIAIYAGAKKITYAEVLDRSNRIAHALHTLGAKPNRLIAIIMEKGWEQIVASLAILQSGAAYLPINADWPKERIKNILRQGEVKIILSQTKILTQLEEAGFFTHEHRYVYLAVDDDKLWKKYSTAALPRQQTPDDIAYVIFTSGSTGVPKGVVVSHRNALNTILDINHCFQVKASDKIFAISKLSFDLSVYDIFGLLAAGGAIVLPDEEHLQDANYWFEQLTKTKVTIWNSVPMLMQILVNYLKQLPKKKFKLLANNLRLVLLSGDWIPLDLPKQIQKIFPRAKIISLGGATEGSIWSIAYPIEKVAPAWASIPYGKALTNQKIYILNNFLEFCPINVPGDIYIGGVGVAQGYWKNPKETKAHYLTHPITRERLYKTGDLGKLLADGNIEFLGREDAMVKVGGYRIELGEIETALRNLPALKDAIVEPIGEGENKRLIAYVIRTNEQESIFFADLLTAEEQLAFKKERHNLRLKNLTKKKIRLASGAFTQAEIDLYFARKSYKRFLDTTINKDLLLNCLQGIREAQPVLPIDLSLKRLGNLLSELRAYQEEGLLLPKYRYPSAGALYPVQIYLSVGTKDILGIEPGNYYYQPYAHSLIKIEQEKIKENFSKEHPLTLHLVEKSSAIKPIYGNHAQAFSDIEAGYLSSLLEHKAKILQLKLTPISLPNPHAILQLNDDDVYHLSFRIHGMDARLKQNNTEITNEPAKLLANREVNIYVYVKPNRVADLSGGLYLWNNRGLQYLGDHHPRTAGFGQSGGNGNLITDATALIMFMGKEKSMNFWQIGEYAQGVMDAAIANKIGSSAMGIMIGETGLEPYLKGKFLHCVALGPVTEKQIKSHEYSEDITYYLQGLRLDKSLNSSLKNSLEQVLPSYMVPEIYVKLHSFPLSVTGKVDRKMLPKPVQGKISARQQFIYPRDLLELQIYKMWSSLLETTKLSVTDDFFMLGGNSLKAVYLATKINNHFHTNYSVSWIYQNNTLEKQAKVIRDKNIRVMYEPILGFNEKGLMPPLIFVHPGHAGAETYIKFAHLLDKEQPFYALESYNLYHPATPLKSIAKLAAQYIKYLKKVRPKGPYYLGGWSYGGLVAFEIARQLTDQGAEVKAVYLLDSFYLASAARKESINYIEIANSILQHKDFYAELPPQYQKRIIKTNTIEEQSMANYVAKPYKPKVVLFKAKREQKITLPEDDQIAQQYKLFMHNLFLNSSNGWAQIARDLQIKIINGDHYDIMHDENNLKEIARFINDDMGREKK